MTTSTDFTVEVAAAYLPGDPIIYLEHVRRGPKKEIPALFLGLSGSQSAIIDIGGVTKTVKRTSLKAVATENPNKEEVTMASRTTKTKTEKTKPAPASEPEVQEEDNSLRDRMEAATKDINGRGYFQPPISLELDDDKLMTELKDTAGQLVAEDELDDATWELFAEWGVGPKPANAPEPEPEKVEPQDVTAELAAVKKAKDVEALKTIAKNKGIRIPPPFYNDIPKLKEYLTEKLNGLAEGIAPTKKKSSTKGAAKAKKDPATPRYTRANAFAEVINAGETNKEAILEKSNAAYVAQGGKDNIKEAKWMYGIASSVLVALGLATETEDTFALNK